MSSFILYFPQQFDTSNYSAPVSALIVFCYKVWLVGQIFYLKYSFWQLANLITAGFLVMKHFELELYDSNRF